MRKLIYIIAIAATALASCTKEIELDYNDIDPIPVIEGYLSPDNTVVTITKTRNMDDSTTTPGIKVDDVRVILPDGGEVPFEFQSDGNYRPTGEITLNDGST